jgi:hypothetical protein
MLTARADPPEARPASAMIARLATTAPVEIRQVGLSPA